MIKKSAIIGMILAIISLPSLSFAIAQVITATARFISPLSITSVVGVNFGNLTAGVASTVYKLDTSNTLTVVSGPGVSESGTKVSGSFLLKGSAAQTVDVSVGSYTSSGGVTPSAATCRYGTGSEVPCTDVSLDTAPAPSPVGKTLKIGLTITAANISDNVTVTPGMTITVLYN